MLKKTMMGLSAAALCLSLLVAAAPAKAGENMSARITAAKTAADHEAIAADYAKQAAAAREEAAAHEKMAKSYAGLGKTGQYHADRHCQAIAQRYLEQAKELDALAEVHRAEAKKAGK
jgi:hypothetical protein